MSTKTVKLTVVIALDTTADEAVNTLENNTGVLRAPREKGLRILKSDRLEHGEILNNVESLLSAKNLTNIRGWEDGWSLPGDVINKLELAFWFVWSYEERENALKFRSNFFSDKTIMEDIVGNSGLSISFVHVCLDSSSELTTDSCYHLVSSFSQAESMLLVQNQFVNGTIVSVESVYQAFLAGVLVFLTTDALLPLLRHNDKVWSIGVSGIIGISDKTIQDSFVNRTAMFVSESIITANSIKKEDFSIEQEISLRHITTMLSTKENYKEYEEFLPFKFRWDGNKIHIKRVDNTYSFELSSARMEDWPEIVAKAERFHSSTLTSGWLTSMENAFYRAIEVHRKTLINQINTCVSEDISGYSKALNLLNSIKSDNENILDAKVEVVLSDGSKHFDVSNLSDSDFIRSFNSEVAALKKAIDEFPSVKNQIYTQTSWLLPTIILLIVVVWNVFVFPINSLIALVVSLGLLATVAITLYNSHNKMRKSIEEQQQKCLELIEHRDKSILAKKLHKLVTGTIEEYQEIVSHLYDTIDKKYSLFLEVRDNLQKERKIEGELPFSIVSTAFQANIDHIKIFNELIKDSIKPNIIFKENELFNFNNVEDLKEILQVIVKPIVCSKLKGMELKDALVNYSLSNSTESEILNDLVEKFDQNSEILLKNNFRPTVKLRKLLYPSNSDINSLVNHQFITNNNIDFLDIDEESVLILFNLGYFLLNTKHHFVDVDSEVL